MPFDNLKPYTVDIIESHVDFMDYPFMISPCIPGVRCFIDSGEIKGVNGLIIKNTYIIQYVKQYLSITDGILDCIITLDKAKNSKEVMEVVTSEKSLNEKRTIIQVHDHIKNQEDSYNERMNKVIQYVLHVNKPEVAFVPQRLIYGLMQLKQYEQACKLAGYEGVIIRKYSDTYPSKLKYKKLTMV